MIKPFIFWCQKVLPLVYDDSLSYYEVLSKVAYKINEVIDNENKLNMSFEEFTKYILDYISTISVKDEVEREMQELIESGYFETLINQQIFDDIISSVDDLKETREYVSPDMYGAKGDGETNDIVAFNNAIMAANIAGKTVVLSGDKTYYISGTIVPVKTNFDGNGATIKMTDGSRIKIGNETLPDPITVPSAVMTNNSVNFNSLKGKTAKLQTPFNLGERNASVSGVYEKYTVVVQIDESGYFTSGSLGFKELPQGDYTFSNILDKYEKPITFKNVELLCVSETRNQMLQIVRNNVTVENIRIYGESGSQDVAIQVIGCNVSLKNIMGRSTNKSTGTWGYMIGLTSCDNVLIENCNVDNYRNGTWGAFQSEFAGNVTMINSNFSRFDTHVNSWGNNILINCRIGCARISGGVVNYKFENCVFDINDGFTNVACIDSRNDYAIPIIGVVEVNSCILNKSKRGFRYRAEQRSTACDYNTYFNVGLRVIYIGCTVNNPFYMNDIQEPLSEKMNISIKDCDLIPSIDAYPVFVQQGSANADSTVLFEGVNFLGDGQFVAGNIIGNVYISDSCFNGYTVYANRCNNLFIRECNNGIVRSRDANINVYLNNNIGVVFAGGNANVVKNGINNKSLEWTELLAVAKQIIFTIAVQNFIGTNRTTFFRVVIDRENITNNRNIFFGDSAQLSDGVYTCNVVANNATLESVNFWKNGSDAGIEFSYTISFIA